MMIGIQLLISLLAPEFHRPLTHLRCFLLLDKKQTYLMKYIYVIYQLISPQNKYFKIRYISWYSSFSLPEILFAVVFCKNNDSSAIHKSGRCDMPSNNFIIKFCAMNESDSKNT